MTEIGVMIRTVRVDSPELAGKALANAISQEFDVICTEKDLDKYEYLHLNYQIECNQY